MRIAKHRYAPWSHCVRAVSPLLLSAYMAVAAASNLNFLNDTPMSYIKTRDVESLKRSLVKVLNTTKDGETSRWTNEGTGNSVAMDATMTPESTSRNGTKTCRRISVVLTAKGQSMHLHPLFCGTGESDWTLQKR